MENLNLAPSPVTPYIHFDIDENIFELKGRSSPDNSLGFYGPIFQFIDEYTEQAVDELKINVNLEYFNTSSLKCIFQMLKKLSGLQDKGTDVQINWHYEEDDDDMLETGEDIEDLLGVEFNFIEESEEGEVEVVEDTWMNS